MHELARTRPPIHWLNHEPEFFIGLTKREFYYVMIRGSIQALCIWAGILIISIQLFGSPFLVSWSVFVIAPYLIWACRNDVIAHSEGQHGSGTAFKRARVIAKQKRTGKGPYFMDAGRFSLVRERPWPSRSKRRLTAYRKTLQRFTRRLFNRTDQ